MRLFLLALLVSGGSPASAAPLPFHLRPVELTTATIRKVLADIEGRERINPRMAEYFADALNAENKALKDGGKSDPEYRAQLYRGLSKLLLRYSREQGGAPMFQKAALPLLNLLERQGYNAALRKNFLPPEFKGLDIAEDLAPMILLDLSSALSNAREPGDLLKALDKDRKLTDALVSVLYCDIPGPKALGGQNAALHLVRNWPPLNNFSIRSALNYAGRDNADEGFRSRANELKDRLEQAERENP